MYFDEDGDGVVTADWLVCTGSYAGRSKDGQSDVILMAGHCLPPAEEEIPASALRFSFDRDARDGVTGTIAAKSYHQMPGFGHDAGDRRDLGIVLLPAGSASGRPSVQLPRAGYLDALKASGALKFLTVDLVGYGAIPIWTSPDRRSSPSTASAAPAPRPSSASPRPSSGSTRTATASAPAPACASGTPARRSSSAGRCGCCR